MLLYFLLILGLHVLLRRDHVQPERGRRQHEEVRRLHPRHPCRPPDRRVPRLRADPHHAARLDLPRPASSLIPLIALVAVGANQNFPFGGTSILIIVGVGLETVKQIDVAAAAASLRRVPPLMTRLHHPRARPAPARARRPRASPSGSASPPSRPATSSARNIKNGTELGQQVKAIVDAGGYVPDELTNAIVARPARTSRTPPAASCSTATRAPSARWPSSTRCSADAGAPLDAVLELDRRRGRDRRAGCSSGAETEGRADDTEEVIRHRLEIYERETAPLVDVYRERGVAASRSTASATSTRSPRVSRPRSRRLDD